MQQNYYKLNKEKFLKFVNDAFNIDNTTHMILYNLIDYLKADNHSYESYYINNNSKDKIYIESYIFTLSFILNNSYIYISIEELYKNNILDITNYIISL